MPEALLLTVVAPDPVDIDRAWRDLRDLPSAICQRTAELADMRARLVEAKHVVERVLANSSRIAIGKP